MQRGSSSLKPSLIVEEIFQKGFMRIYQYVQTQTLRWRCLPLVERFLGDFKRYLTTNQPGYVVTRGKCSKKGGSNLVTLLHQLINAIWETGHMPDKWREGIIAPIWKAGGKTDVRNYRGICLQSVAAQVYSNILKARLRGWAEEALLEVQYGFRNGRGCSDAIFVLRGVID